MEVWQLGNAGHREAGAPKRRKCRGQHTERDGGQARVTSEPRKRLEASGRGVAWRADGGRGSRDLAAAGGALCGEPARDRKDGTGGSREAACGDVHQPGQLGFIAFLKL